MSGCVLQLRTVLAIKSLLHSSIVQEGEKKVKHSNEKADLPSLYIYFFIYHRKYITKINIYKYDHIHVCV